MSMGESITNTFSTVDFDAIAKKQQTEKKEAQEAAQKEFESSIWGGGLKKLTGIDSHNFGLFDSSASKDDSVLTGIGQVVAAPLHVGGGILGGVLGVVGQILSPVLGILGGLFGGGVQGQPNVSGQPNQPDQQKSPTGKVGDTSAGSTDSTSGGTSQADGSDSTTKSGSVKDGKNAENRTIGTHYDFDKSQHVANFETGGAEKYSTYAGAMVEELNDSNADLETLKNEQKTTQSEIEKLKAENKGVAADEKTKAKAQMEEYKSSMDTYQGQLDGIAKDIEAQEALKSQYPDRKDEIDKTISALKAQQAEVTKGFKDAKAKYEKAEQKYNKAGKDVAKSDSPQAKLAQLEAKLERINQRITVAESRDAKIREELKKACEYEKTLSEKDGYDPTSRKSEAQKFTSALDGAENKAKGVKSSDTARLSAEETIPMLTQMSSKAEVTDVEAGLAYLKKLEVEGKTEIDTNSEDYKKLPKGAKSLISGMLTLCQRQGTASADANDTSLPPAIGKTDE